MSSEVQKINRKFLVQERNVKIFPLKYYSVFISKLALLEIYMDTLILFPLLF